MRTKKSSTFWRRYARSTTHQLYSGSGRRSHSSSPSLRTWKRCTCRPTVYKNRTCTTSSAVKILASSMHLCTYGKRIVAPSILRSTIAFCSRLCQFSIQTWTFWWTRCDRTSQAARSISVKILPRVHWIWCAVSTIYIISMQIYWQFIEYFCFWLIHSHHIGV